MIPVRLTLSPPTRLSHRRVAHGHAVRITSPREGPESISPRQRSKSLPGSPRPAACFGVAPTTAFITTSYGQRLAVSKATGPQLDSSDSVRSKDSIARVRVYDITRADSTLGQSDSPSTLAESVVVGLTSPCPWRVEHSHLPTPTSV